MDDCKSYYHTEEEAFYWALFLWIGDCREWPSKVMDALLAWR